jgi:hypothetical protein
MRRVLGAVLLTIVSAATVLAGDALPFKGTWSGSTISATFTAPDQVLVVATGAGQATVVGKFVMTSPHITFLATFGLQGTQVFVDPATNDVLNASFTGALAPNADGNLEGILPATITGGTGRFAGATGSYQFHIVARPAAFGFDSTATIDGSLRLAQN